MARSATSAAGYRSSGARTKAPRPLQGERGGGEGGVTSSRPTPPPASASSGRSTTAPQSKPPPPKASAPAYWRAPPWARRCGMRRTGCAARLSCAAERSIARGAENAPNPARLAGGDLKRSRDQVVERRGGHVQLVQSLHLCPEGGDFSLGGGTGDCLRQHDRHALIAQVGPPPAESA